MALSFLKNLLASAPDRFAEPYQVPEIITDLKPHEFPGLTELIKANIFINLDQISRHQDLERDVFEWTEKPQYVIFISHRWATPTHPDPEGQTLKTVQYLLSAVRELALTWNLPKLERLSRVSTLKRHGFLQAARIIGHMKADNATIDSSILDKIGIWLDFMCLPQKDASGLDDRSAEERGRFKQGLRVLPSLVASSNSILSIRHQEDDYIERAWCVSELCYSSYKHLKNVTVLRADCLGQPISEELLDVRDDPFADIFKGLLNKWETEQEYRWNPNLDFLYSGLEEVEDRLSVRTGPESPTRWPAPFLTTPRPPLIFPLQGNFLLNVRTFLTQEPPRNVAVLVPMMMKEAGISCYDIDDFLRCGLQILHARMTGHKGWHRFFNDCLRRLADGEHLVLGETTEVEIKDGIDFGYRVRYRFKETTLTAAADEERLLRLHNQATAVWKEHHDQLQGSGSEQLLNFGNALQALQVSVERMLMERPIWFDMMRVLDNALQNSGLALDGDLPDRVRVGLCLMYACCHSQYVLKFHENNILDKLSTFILNALGRVLDGSGLWVADLVMELQF